MPNAGNALIVGLGARTPVGLRALTSAVAALAGVTRLQEHPYMRDRAGESFVVGMDRTLDPHERHERMFVLALSALSEALGTLPVRSSQTVVPIYLALPETDGRPGEPLLQGALCRRLTAALASSCTAPVIGVPRGNAAGVVALEHALGGLHDGQFDCCVVGGVDSWLDPDLLEPLDRGGYIASSTNRWGFPPGEAAAALAVCSPSFAHRHGLRPLARVAATAYGTEENRIFTETICLGRGLADVLGRAATAARAPVDRQFCDIDGLRYREHEFSLAVLRLPAARFIDTLAYEAPAGRWGNVGAASIPMLSMLPIVAHMRGRSRGRWPLVWSGSNSGLRGALLLHLES